MAEETGRGGKRGPWQAWIPEASASARHRAHAHIQLSGSTGRTPIPPTSRGSRRVGGVLGWCHLRQFIPKALRKRVTGLPHPNPKGRCPSREADTGTRAAPCSARCRGRRRPPEARRPGNLPEGSWSDRHVAAPRCGCHYTQNTFNASVRNGYNSLIFHQNLNLLTDCIFFYHMR